MSGELIEHLYAQFHLLLALASAAVALSVAYVAIRCVRSVLGKGNE